MMYAADLMDKLEYCPVIAAVRESSFQAALESPSEVLFCLESHLLTVRMANRADTMVSVKTAAPVPNDNMTEVMKKLRSIQIDAPVSIGDVVLTDLCGTDIVITKTIL